MSDIVEGLIRSGSLVRFGLIIMILGDIYLQRLGIPLGDQNVPLCIMTTYLGLALMSLGGDVMISFWRATTWLVVVSCMVISVIFEMQSFSFLSLWFLIAVYTPLIFMVTASQNEYRKYLELFQWAMIPIVVLAVYQFITNDATDYIERYFANWVMQGFNTHPVLSYGSSVMRSNGYFFLEPSYLSQWLAVAIILELMFCHKWWRLAAYGTGLVCAASGSGTTLLMVFLVLYAWNQRKVPHLIAVGILGSLFLWAVSDSEIVATMLNRTTEVQDTDSSAYNRFVAPFLQTFNQLDDLSSWLVGLGPGSSNAGRLLAAGWSQLQVGTPIAPLKMLVEYGLIGAIPFIVFIVQCFFRGSRSYVMSVSMFFLYCMLAGGLQSPHSVYLCFFVLILFPQALAEIPEKFGVVGEERRMVADVQPQNSSRNG